MTIELFLMKIVINMLFKKELLIYIFDGPYTDFSICITS